jgi:hypothetical protein
MNPIQESKQELEAAIRYSENAISKAKQTIESMEFRQEMAKKESSEQTGREQALEAEVVELKSELDKLRKEKEASSGPCGCQAYRDLEERATMPVIPKAVAIAIFREGVQHGVEAACTELEGKAIEIDENEYCGGFEVNFTKEIDLDDELDLDWMRGKCGDYSEERAIDALSNLCADKEFEWRIQEINDQEE